MIPFKTVKKKGQSVQELLGIKAFTQYGLSVGKDELIFFHVSPTNISVLSEVNIAAKIRHLMVVLSAIPDIEINCTDSSECFDDNMAYLKERLENEENKRIRNIIEKDMDFLDTVQIEMATARQFLFIVRCRNMKPEQVFHKAVDVEKKIAGEGFEVRRMKKADIKRFLALYFDASKNGEQMPDYDGEQYMQPAEELPTEKEKTITPKADTTDGIQVVNAADFWQKGNDR